MAPSELVSLALSVLSFLLMVVFLIDRKHIVDRLSSMEKRVQAHHEDDHVDLARTLGRMEEKVRCSRDRN